MSDLPETGKPPDGVLAQQALAGLKEPATRDARLDAPSQAAVPVDPNYTEPYTLVAFREMADLISASESPAQALLDQNLQRKSLVKFLLTRIKVLEDALLPFALSAMVMSNSRMCLIADHRPDEPAGGVWVSKVPDGIQLQPNEGYFFNACDAIGRQRTNDYMSSVLERVQQAAALQTEKDAHVAADGKLH